MFDRFRTLSQVQQILLISGLLAGCGAALVTIWLVFVRTPYQPLFSDLRPADAATIVAELDRKKIPYRLSDGGTTISVPADRVDATRLNVMTEDLPLKGTVGFELFNKSDIGLTDFAQKINYIRAIQGELERTVMMLDGVAAARVHVSIGEDRVFRDDQVPPKASVSVRMAKGASFEPNAVLGIQRLIAAAIPKLETSNVVVLDEVGRIISAPPTAERIPPPSPTAQQKMAVEQYYESRIRQALEQSYPADNVQVHAVAAIPLEAMPRILSAWTPNVREFPLQITLSLTRSLDGSAEAAMRGMVTAAVGLNAVRGDAIEFDIVQPEEPAQAEASAPAVVPRNRNWPAAPAASQEHSWYWDAPVVLVPLLVLATIMLLLRKAYRPRRMTDTQRAQFTTKLQRALEGRDGRATASS